MSKQSLEVRGGQNGDTLTGDGTSRDSGERKRKVRGKDGEGVGGWGFGCDSGVNHWSRGGFYTEVWRSGNGTSLQEPGSWTCGP